MIKINRKRSAGEASAGALFIRRGDVFTGVKFPFHRPASKNHRGRERCVLSFGVTFRNPSTRCQDDRTVLLAVLSLSLHVQRGLIIRHNRIIFETTKQKSNLKLPIAFDFIFTASGKCSNTRKPCRKTGRKDSWGGTVFGRNNRSRGRTENYIPLGVLLPSFTKPSFLPARAQCLRETGAELKLNFTTDFHSSSSVQEFFPTCNCESVAEVVCAESCVCLCVTAGLCWV